MEVAEISTSAVTKNKTLDMVYCAMFAVLIAICAWISIPTIVPFSMQTFGVFVAVGTLGGKRGSISVFIYLLLGSIGIPVFTGFAGGLGILLGKTGGYMMGFLFSALFMWAMEKVIGKRKGALAFSMVLGLIVCYVFGTLWFMVIYGNSAGEVGVMTALSWCVFPFIIPDILKILLALVVCRRLAKIIKSN